MHANTMDSRVRWNECGRDSRIYEVFPLHCPIKCGGETRIIAFITDAPTVRAILAHLGEPTAQPAAAAFDPPDPTPNARGRVARVAGRGYPRPAPSEPCMGLSIHTAQASTKASFDTRLHNCFVDLVNFSLRD